MREQRRENSSGGLGAPESVEQASVWLAEAIEWAHGRGATDLHFFPSENEAMLWVRIDGELQEAARYSLSAHTRMMARLKILGRCSDYEGELVQEGRFTLNGAAASGEARLSIMPTLRGDKAVVRLLTGGQKLRRLDELGFTEKLATALREATDRPQGMVLAIGPSGSGKSTALYALLRDLHERAGHPISIVSIEDPVEQSMPFAAQISADPARGLGFVEGLRALLRQDPEVIMIGEIRDGDTSTAALQAALTGHRLVSSMHTLSAAEALVRLQQMGSPPYAISSALAGVLNLRLVKLLCPDCRRTRLLTAAERELLPEAEGWSEPTLAEAGGCDACLGTGHRGRTGIGEWLRPTQETAVALQAHQPAQEIAGTLERVVGARDAAVELLGAHRISIGQWQKLAGLSTLEAAGGNAST